MAVEKSSGSRGAATGTCLVASVIASRYLIHDLSLPSDKGFEGCNRVLGSIGIGKDAT